MKLLFSLLVCITLSSCGISSTPGQGEKIGQIVKINKVGIISKTWEAELIRGGMNGGNGSFGMTPFDFTIESEELAKKVQEYMRNQTEVRITYRIEGVWKLIRSDTGIFLESIEPINK